MGERVVVNTVTFDGSRRFHREGCRYVKADAVTATRADLSGDVPHPCNFCFGYVRTPALQNVARAFRDLWAAA